MSAEGIAFAFSVWALPVVLAVTLHEAAHGWVAWKCGDDTAKRLGRVTFNPLSHVDLFGTIILPALLLFLSGGRMMFGFAKPVPVDFRRLRRPRQQMVLVAAAGPATNLVLAVIAAVLLGVAPNVATPIAEWLRLNLENALWINVLLAVFNMLPLPPLDGGRVAVGLLPAPLARPLARLERFGFAIIIGVVFLLPFLGSRIGVDLNVFYWVVIVPADALAQVILIIAGAT